jgi:hypothetical protein
MFAIREGISPVKKFLDRLSYLRYFRSPISLGMIPSKLFLERSMYMKTESIFVPELFLAP